MLVVRKFQRLNSRNTKIILMSATIDTDIYSEYFARDSRGQLLNAYVLDVAGKANTVSVFYMENLVKLAAVPELDISDPRVAPECYDIAHQLIRTFDRIESNEADKTSMSVRGTVLIFLPGYEHIEEMKKMLEKGDLHMQKKWWILPLHSSITIEEQKRVFKAPQPGFRKIILSTNIAESSITVSDIKFVIDFCLAKCLNRDPATNYVSLKLEWASQASCDQRKGRAGRVSSGRVYRLVPESLFNDFEKFTTPEIKRCPLELVILKAKRLDLGEPKAVLALSIEPPEIYGIEKSVLTLKELGALALTSNGNYSPYDGDMTFIGHVMSLLPLDAKLSKFILFGHVFDCLDDCIIIAACLSVMNFFSKPFGKKLEAYKSKLSWAENSFSDCFSYWHAYNTWSNFVATSYFKRPGGQSERDWAKHQFVELSRLYEVRNLVEEIKKRLHPLGIRTTYHPAEVPTDMSKKEKVFILSVCLCGAFYPNYFIQAEIDEKLVYRELSKKNPLNTVYLSSLPSNEGIFYEDQIRNLLQGCSTQLRVEFEGSKALVQFETPNILNTAMVNPAVFMAIKLRQENVPMEINLLQPSILRRKKELIDKKMEEHCSKNSRLTNNRICLVQEVTKLKNTVLPSLSQFTIKLTITEVLNCGNFYARYSEPEYELKLSYVESAINMYDANSTLKHLTEALQVNSLVLAPYPGKSEVKYYRGIVQAIDMVKKHADVFFVDYGNKMELPIKDLREFDPDIDEQLYNIPTLALRCRLACLRPIFSLDSQPGDWSSKATVFFRDFVENKVLIGRIYSIVDRCVNLFLVRVEPDGQETDINKELIRRGYAEHCEEDYLSKENHDLRQTFETMTEAQQEMASKQATGQEDFFRISLSDNTNIEDIHYSRKTRLRGPYSPLESTFFGISQVSSHKRVVIERDSVNSITLDPEPHNHQTRLLVASYVSLNSRGDVMNARNTTLMPPINGLPALMILLFTPAMELRRNCQRTKYTGAICGLGYNPETKRAYYPDHDCEIEFDVMIDQEDLVDINFLRTCINLVLGDSEKYTNNTISHRYIGDIRKNAKKHIQKLLSKPRPTQERMPPQQPYTWGIIPDSDFIIIKMMGKDDDEYSENNINLLPMHKAVYLNREEITSQEKRQQLELFRSRASNSNTPELNKCILCNKMTYSPREIIEHLQENEHMSLENYFKQAIVNDDD